MKKKVLAVAAVGLMSLGLLTGCGSQANVPTEASIEMDEDNAVVQDSEDTDVEEPTEEVEEVTEETTEELTWFEEQGLAITAQGDFTYVTTAYDIHNESNTMDVEVSASIIITETTDGVEDGYKNVIAVVTLYMGEVPEAYGVKNRCEAFDRYSGTDVWYPFPGTADLDEVSAGFEIRNGEESQTITMTVTCPIDYDGIVFQIGKDSPSLWATYNTLDFDAGITIDETPYYGDGYYYFSYTNE